MCLESHVALWLMFLQMQVAPSGVTCSWSLHSRPQVQPFPTLLGPPRSPPSVGGHWTDLSFLAFAVDCCFPRVGMIISYLSVSRRIWTSVVFSLPDSTRRLNLMSPLFL